MFKYVLCPFSGKTYPLTWSCVDPYMSHLFYFSFWTLFDIHCFANWSPVGLEGGRGTLCNDQYGEALPERGTFFRLQVHERVGILLVEVYNRVGESVIWVFLRIQKSWQMNVMAFKSRGTFYFCDWSMIYSSWKECKVLNKVCERGTICQ